MSVKVAAAINSMNKQGHYARICRHQGKMWVEVDQCMLVSFDEIEELVDGVHAFEELGAFQKEACGRTGLTLTSSRLLGPGKSGPGNLMSDYPGELTHYRRPSR